MIRIFKTSYFKAWQKKAKLSDAQLIEAINEVQRGLIDAELGGFLLKKRISRIGAGKRSGYRTLIATKRESRWFFIYGFAKNERENIEPDELKALKELANTLLVMNEKELNLALKNKAVQEIENG
jgi:hypothetical protein